LRITPAALKKCPQAISLGLYEQSPPSWAEIFIGCGGSLCSYSCTLPGCRILAKVLSIKVNDEPLKVKFELLKVNFEPLKVNDELLKVNDELLKVNFEPLKVNDELLKVKFELLKVKFEPLNLNDEPLNSKLQDPNLNYDIAILDL
jgi:hypothetical protein